MSNAEILNRLNAADRPRTTVNLRPRDAASLILIDNEGPEARMLVGKRHPGHVFIPNKVVFPGGRVDPSDTRLKVPGTLPEVEQAKLLLEMKGRPSIARTRGLALAAVRELFEETGLVLGTPLKETVQTSVPIWRDFLNTGYAPQIASLQYFARAITPPRRPRRYDTRFFVASARDVRLQARDADGELSDLQWLTFEEARSADLHIMTRTIVDEVEQVLDKNGRPRRRKSVPFYFERHGTFLCDVLKVA